MRWRAPLAMASMSLVCALAAYAEETVAPENLSGLWTFEAKVDPICRFTGQARLQPTDDPARFDCELTARQACPSVDILYVVEQSCTVTLENGVASVESSIVGFLEGEPTPNYLPDHFQLAVENAAHLKGILLGSNAYPAEWRRAEGAIS